MSNQEAYGYAVARIRAMEHRLLDAGAMQRMTDAEDAASVLKILGETSYAAALTSQTGDQDFDKALESELHSVYEEVEAFVPDKDLVEVLRYPYDFHNVKVIMKSIFSARSGGRKRWDLLTSLGSCSVDALVANVEAEDYRLLPFGLNTLIPRCIAAWEQSKDVLEVERQLDNRLYEVMLEKAEQLDMPGMIGWMRVRTDGENIRTLVRLKRFGFDAARALPFMHRGGDLDVSVLTPLISEPFESWGRALSFSDFGALLNGIDAAGGFAELILLLEKTLDDFYLDKIAGSRFTSSAPENIPMYLWAKELEVKNVRMILVSKSSKSDKDQLRRLLRHGYC
jgi:V/A-type H+-transporting ATPase subunit C